MRMGGPGWLVHAQYGFDNEMLWDETKRGIVVVIQDTLDFLCHPSNDPTKMEKFLTLGISEVHAKFVAKSSSRLVGQIKFETSNFRRPVGHSSAKCDNQLKLGIS